jgi:Raf kinase inhibitor-like YbhB/YbcL family protein
VKLNSLSFFDGEAIPDRYALSRNSSPTTLEPAENLNPHLAWDEVPDGTASFAVLCADLDAPDDRSGINKPGTTLPDDCPRSPFYHWVLVDLPVSVREIDEGAFVAVREDDATPARATPPCRQGYNDYADMPGLGMAVGHGYGGPAPPWNDARAHRYRYTVYAVSVPSLALPEAFKAADVLQAMRGHVLAQATLTGIYTLNASLAPTQVGSPSVT